MSFLHINAASVGFCFIYVDLFFYFVFVLIKLLQGCVVFSSKRRSKIFELKQISYSLLYYLLQMQYYYGHLKAQTTLLQRPTDGAIDHSTNPITLTGNVGRLLEFVPFPLDFPH